jgi:hypothetical protein
VAPRRPPRLRRPVVGRVLEPARRAARDFVRLLRHVPRHRARRGGLPPRRRGPLAATPARNAAAAAAVPPYHPGGGSARRAAAARRRGKADDRGGAVRRDGCGAIPGRPAAHERHPLHAHASRGHPRRDEPRPVDRSRPAGHGEDGYGRADHLQPLAQLPDSAAARDHALEPGAQRHLREAHES